MTTLRLKSKRGGFFRPFGCGWFIREVLAGNAPYGSPVIMRSIGAPQADIFRHYKLDISPKLEEKKARREKRLISPENIEGVTERFLARMPYKAWGCRYHSLVRYVSSIRKLGWIETTGQWSRRRSRVTTRLASPVSIAARPLQVRPPLTLLGRTLSLLSAGNRRYLRVGGAL